MEKNNEWVKIQRNNFDPNKIKFTESKGQYTSGRKYVDGDEIYFGFVVNNYDGINNILPVEVDENNVMERNENAHNITLTLVVFNLDEIDSTYQIISLFGKKYPEYYERHNGFPYMIKK